MSMPIPVSSYQDYLDYVEAHAHPKTMDDFSSYPKFQYSVFPNGNRDEQLVVRAESFSELQSRKSELDGVLNGQPTTTGNSDSNDTKPLKCDKCGGDAEYREGVSKKTNKSYKGVFCTNPKCDFAKFL